MIHDLPFKVVRSNGTDEVLARANLKIASANLAAARPLLERSKGGQWLEIGLLFCSETGTAGRSLALFQRQWLIAGLCHGDTAKTAIEGENSGQTTPSDCDACQTHRSVAAGAKGGFVLFHGAIITGALLPPCYLDHAGQLSKAETTATAKRVAILSPPPALVAALWLACPIGPANVRAVSRQHALLA
jgi:hypothetical protein